MPDNAQVAQPEDSPVQGSAPWWRHLLTGKDNSTLDLGRVSWAICTLATIGKEAWSIHAGNGSSVRDFAIALAGIAAAHGAALGFKGRTEPGGEA